MKVTGPYFVVAPAISGGFCATLHDSAGDVIFPRVWGTSADSTLLRAWMMWGGQIPAVVRL